MVMPSHGWPYEYLSDVLNAICVMACANFFIYHYVRFAMVEMLSFVPSIGVWLQRNCRPLLVDVRASDIILIIDCEYLIVSSFFVHASHGVFGSVEFTAMAACFGSMMRHALNCRSLFVEIVWCVKGFKL